MPPKKKTQKGKTPTNKNSGKQTFKEPPKATEVTTKEHDGHVEADFNGIHVDISKPEKKSSRRTSQLEEKKVEESLTARGEHDNIDTARTGLTSEEAKEEPYSTDLAKLD